MDKEAINLAKQTTLNRAFNRIADVLDEEGVRLGTRGFGCAVLTKDGHYLSWHEGIRTRAYNHNEPPIDYDDFLARQCQTDREKGHDYGNSYMAALVKFGPVIWKWEATKKINRIRTWLAKGILVVRGEGVVNAVGDLFNYTVMYRNYQEALLGQKDPVQLDNPRDFYRMATTYSPSDWVDLLVDEGLITPEERDLQRYIFAYIAGPGVGYK